MDINAGGRGTTIHRAAVILMARIAIRITHGDVMATRVVMGMVVAL